MTSASGNESLERPKSAAKLPGQGGWLDALHGMSGEIDTGGLEEPHAVLEEFVEAMKLKYKWGLNSNLWHVVEINCI